MTHSRRKFLQYSSIAGIGLTLKPLAAVSSMAQTQAPGFHLEPGQQLITLLQTTDVHCQLQPHDELFWENEKEVFRTVGGYAHIASLFDEAKKNNPNTFIVDTGDMFQGSMLSVQTTGKAIQPILDAMGYNLYLPGNWEVVYYKEPMQKLLGGLSAPKICANMYHELPGGGRGEHIFPPYYTWTVAGVKIGFIGYTDPLVPVRQSPLYSKGIIYTQPEENLAHFVQVLREQEACSYVIILAHLGLSQQIALANSPACNGVDYIFGGDTHERVREPIQCQFAKVVEPGAFGSFVGRLDLVVKEGKIVGEKYSLVEVDPGKYKAQPAMQALIEKQELAYRNSINRIIGYSTLPLYRYFVVENTIDTLIINALKWKVGTDIVLSNGFRFCPPRNTRDANGRIPITEGYLYDMLPVDSQVRIGKVKGSQLKEWLEKELNNVFAKDASKRLGGWVVKFKGMKIAFKAFADEGKRVQTISVNGSPLQMDQTYSICACEREGDPDDMLCRIPHVQQAKNTGYYLHGVLKDYLASHSPVTPAPELNAVIMDAPQKLLSQVTDVPYKFT